MPVSNAVPREVVSWKDYLTVSRVRFLYNRFSRNRRRPCPCGAVYARFVHSADVNGNLLPCDSCPFALRFAAVHSL